MRHLCLAFILLTASGCSALKERTGEYVSEAVVDHIAEKVDQRLERRGLSISQIRSITDLNNDGSVDMSEVRETARLAAGEVATSHTDDWARRQRDEWNAASKNFITIDENTTVKGKIAEFWTWLGATIAALISTIIAYLTKQILSAKSDGRRDADIARQTARTDALERLLGKDLDNDGMIGHNRTPVNPGEGHDHPPGAAGGSLA